MRIRLPGDARLAGIVVGTAEHFAQGIGFDETAQRALLAATEQAFCDAAEAAANSCLEVTVEGAADRVEIVLEGKLSWPAPGKPAYSGVDRVEVEARGSVSRLKLVKFARSSSASRNRP